MKMGKAQFLSRVGPLLLGVALMMVLASSAFALVWNNEIVDSDGDVGSHTSLAVDSNNQPHISYYDSTNRDLKYARWDGSAWHTLGQGVNNICDVVSLFLEELETTVNRLSEGDLTAKIEQEFEGRFSEVATRLNNTIATLSGTIGKTICWSK